MNQTANTYATYKPRAMVADILGYFRRSLMSKNTITRHRIVESPLFHNPHLGIVYDQTNDSYDTMSRAPTTLSDESLHLQSLYWSYVLRWFLPTHVWNVGQGCEPTLNSSDYQPLWDTGTVCPAGPGSAISRHSQDAKKGCARHPRTGVLHTAQVFKKTN
ncbi:hypothetical protein FOPG_01068 [Fusarium oxysporum f. sp. conglutinans race 2 54008]|uniref:Uncharacterized protein n=1 Tax=Fusarium oxysporum f. sp. conglutinans race 2 54008 TaxID=1089457 RepID=X0IGU2_FUSOX|nr:hypothetical protein FOPG_01068 [Fusarium oxysporum f. sp. conglutinans race 2 54008]KAI8408681.1 hypothetical protein FOFC_11627 [Fusarium oxysporum]